ncbi:restriction endonuclease subunit S [Microbacterium sp.]|uniref:restriction endonuclease subunit S n=1 Tax=Microbacterium sp. TaxID=51671 RepID=UPI002737470B|nr:restriction endonuclease subunit S [Microbacterium sp.]MDP3952678.1 restriction endonuclease subunit S [Microbacterium sp.]
MTRLGDILADVKPGFATGDDLDDGVFQFRMHNFTRESALDLTKRRRVNATAKQLMIQSVAPGDVLFNATNSPELVGKSALIGVLDEPAVFSNHFMRLRTDPTQLDPGYLAHFLRFQFGRGVFRAMAKAWVNQATIGRDRLEGLDIPLLPLPEQRRIAAILDHADALRTDRREVLTRLDVLTKSIFNEMFGDPLTNPKGLPRATIGSVAAVVTGNSPSRADTSNFGDSIEWIKSGNLGGDVASTADEWLSETGRAKARVAPLGSILVTCIAGSPTSIGKASMVDRDVAFNQQINAILPSDKIDTAFLLAQLKTAPTLVRAKSTGGMKGLVNKSAFQSIEILLPGIDLQRGFAERIACVASLQSIAKSSLNVEDGLFASLQSRAFRGEL